MMMLLQACRGQAAKVLPSKKYVTSAWYTVLRIYVQSE